MKKSILSMSTDQQKNLYRKETGSEKIEMFTFQSFILNKMFEEIETELNLISR